MKVIGISWYDEGKYYVYVSQTGTGTYTRFGLVQVIVYIESTNLEL